MTAMTTIAFMMVTATYALSINVDSLKMLSPYFYGVTPHQCPNAVGN